MPCFVNWGWVKRWHLRIPNPLGTAEPALLLSFAVRVLTQASARGRRVKCEFQMRLRSLSAIGCTLNKGEWLELLSLYCKSRRKRSKSRGRETSDFISVSAHWSQRRCFLFDDARCCSVCFSPQPFPLLTPLSAWAVCWDFSFTAVPGSIPSSWRHRIWGMSV